MPELKSLTWDALLGDMVCNMTPVMTELFCCYEESVIGEMGQLWSLPYLWTCQFLETVNSFYCLARFEWCGRDIYCLALAF